MISVVIPVFNEEIRLRQTLEEVCAYLRSKGHESFEVVCSDDGSTDRSREIVAEAAQQLPVRGVHAPDHRNQGKGAAVRRGMLAAKGDPVFFFDADLSTPLEEIDRFLSKLEDPEVHAVSGTRKHPDARIDNYQPWLRVVLGLAYTQVVNLMLGVRYSDYTCGFKVFRQAAARDLFERSRITGWSFDAEILYLARVRRWRVVEVPVAWSDDPDSKVRVGSAIFASFRELLTVRWNSLRGRYR